MEELSPAAIGRKLGELEDELAEAYDTLEAASRRYVDAKSEYELAAAKATLTPVEGKETADQRSARVVIATHTQRKALLIAEAFVDASKGQVALLRTKTEIWRSKSALTRSAMELV
jgi:hypothetical protein